MPNVPSITPENSEQFQGILERHPEHKTGDMSAVWREWQEMNNIEPDMSVVPVATRFEAPDIPRGRSWHPVRGIGALAVDVGLSAEETEALKGLAVERQEEILAHRRTTPLPELKDLVRQQLALPPRIHELEPDLPDRLRSHGMTDLALGQLGCLQPATQRILANSITSRHGKIRHPFVYASTLVTQALEQLETKTSDSETVEYQRVVDALQSRLLVEDRELQKDEKHDFYEYLTLRFPGLIDQETLDAEAGLRMFQKAVRRWSRMRKYWPRVRRRICSASRKRIAGVPTSESSWMCDSAYLRPSPRALMVSTNQRLPERWRVKTMKRFGSAPVILHRAGAARRAKTACDGPAARALDASATKASIARVIAASASHQTPTQVSMVHKEM